MRVTSFLPLYVFGASAILVAVMISPPVVAMGVFFCAFIAFLYWIGAFEEMFGHWRLDSPSEAGIDEDLLSYYKEGDPIRDVQGYEQEPETAPIMYTFLGLVEEDGERVAVVYDGDLEGGEEQIADSPHLVKKLTLPQLFAYTNVQATVRREQMRGAKAYCQLQDSDAERERKKEYEKKTAVDELEALPCDIVERTKAKIEGQRQLPLGEVEGKEKPKPPEDVVITEGGKIKTY